MTGKILKRIHIRLLNIKKDAAATQGFDGLLQLVRNLNPVMVADWDSII